MLSPQQERQTKLAEMAPVIRIFAVLFIIVALLIGFPFQLVMVGTYMQVIAIQFVTVLLALYISTIGLEILRKTLAGPAGGPIYLDYITLFGSFAFLGVVLFMTGGIDSEFKIIFLPTVLFYTVRFGLKWGLVSSGLVAVILAAANLHANFTGKMLRLEIDIIYGGVFILTAWLVGAMVDMERSISDRLSRQVIVDYLTGLYNHRHLQDELNRRIAESPAKTFGLIMADLDHFRRYNETYGHQAGDRLLVRAAANITGTVGKAGPVFRFGSDEFAIIVDCAGRDETMSMAKNIQKNLPDSLESSSRNSFWKYDLTASLGLVVFPEDGTTREELLQKVEVALYKAKVIGINKVEAYYSVLEHGGAHISSSEKETIDRLKMSLAMINARDRYTFGHSERVLIYSSLIASLIDLPPEDKKALQHGSYLHDIGKIDLDQSVLNNNGTLNMSEWELFKHHPIWGAEMIKQVKFLEPAIPAILYHHERYDGKGYPFGLAGQSIPITARIVHLCNSFDAMTADRANKPALKYAEAIAELVNNRHRQFDPYLVDVFVQYLRRYNGVQEILALGTKERYLH